MTQQTAQETINPHVAETEEALKRYEGKIVTVVTHFQDGGYDSQNMMCAGKMSNYYLFVNSVMETVSGRKIIQGVRGFEGHTFYNSSKEPFFVRYNFVDDYPYRPMPELEQPDLERILALWKNKT